MTSKTPKAMLWTGRVISAIVVLVMGAMGAVMFIMFPPMVLEGMTKHGYPAYVARPLLAVEVVCAVLYLIPQTAVLGAILLTGYLGGAVATHVRVGEPYGMAVLFGVLVWLGLYLRDGRVRELVPFRRPS